MHQITLMKHFANVAKNKLTFDLNHFISPSL